MPSRYLVVTSLVAASLATACVRSDRNEDIVNDKTPVAGTTGRVVDYLCAGQKKLRITFIGDRAVADTGYDRYSLRETAPGDNTYVPEGSERNVRLDADSNEASLHVSGGGGLQDCVARE
jgi:hypothetical protein